MAPGAPDIGHLGPQMGHRPSLAEQLDGDGDRPVGHLGDEGGVERPERLVGMVQLGGHGPEGQGGDQAALGERVEIPGRVDEPLVLTGSRAVTAVAAKKGLGTTTDARRPLPAESTLGIPVATGRPVGGRG